MATFAQDPSMAPGSGIPFRKESYTTWLYLALAVVVMVLTVFGMWYAGVPRVSP